MTVTFINTAVAGTLTAALYRNGGESYSVYVYQKNPKGKAVLVESYTGTRSECNKFRNAALSTG
jgi:hypothetical protein